MGGEQTTPSGPDLAAGIRITDIPDGGMLQGHVAGEPVLLARRGERVFAVGATCTHYGAPLADGLLVDDTIRCPWHHACFSLVTGEPLRPPALNPIASWRVEREGPRLLVTAKADPVRPLSPTRTPGRKIVIVGASAAGNAAAETLRREGFDGSVTLIGAEASVPVDRPNLSKDYLAGNAPEEWIPLRGTAFYEEKRIALRTGARVASLDPSRKTVSLEGGEVLSFDTLLLATGADPVRLPIPGADLPHVHTLRTLADSRAIIAKAGGARRALVIGASFIGLEVAASLRTRGLEIHVVAPEDVPLERVMGREVGSFVKRLHEEHGVVFRLGRTATAIGPDTATLSDGSTVPAELVVMGVGVRPATALAEKAGLAVDKGVLVDEHFRASARDVFAAGDVARWKDPRTLERLRIEHWVVAERQGAVAARNMLGKREPFDAVPFFWSAHYDVTISYVGHAETWDRIVLDGSLEKRDARIAYVRGGRTLAVATVGRDRESLEAELEMERGARAG